MALRSSWVTSVVISTDDPHLLGSEQSLGVQVLERPPELATDSATTDDAVRDVVRRMPGTDVVVLLQPTSPFRDVWDVDACISLFLNGDGGHPVVSVVELDHPVEWSFELHSGELRSDRQWGELPMRSQDCITRYRVNGAVYVASGPRIVAGASLIEEGTRAIVMPRERSLDIDTEEDLALAEWMAARRSNTEAGE